MDGVFCAGTSSGKDTVLAVWNASAAAILSIFIAAIFRLRQFFAAVHVTSLHAGEFNPLSGSSHQRHEYNNVDEQRYREQQRDFHHQFDRPLPEVQVSTRGGPPLTSNNDHHRSSRGGTAASAGGSSEENSSMSGHTATSSGHKRYVEPVLPPSMIAAKNKPQGSGSGGIVGPTVAPRGAMREYFEDYKANQPIPSNFYSQNSLSSGGGSHTRRSEEDQSYSYEDDSDNTPITAVSAKKKIDPFPLNQVNPRQADGDDDDHGMELTTRRGSERDLFGRLRRGLSMRSDSSTCCNDGEELS